MLKQPRKLSGQHDVGVEMLKSIPINLPILSTQCQRKGHEGEALAPFRHKAGAKRSPQWPGTEAAKLRRKCQVLLLRYAPKTCKIR